MSTGSGIVIGSMFIFFAILDLGSEIRRAFEAFSKVQVNWKREIRIVPETKKEAKKNEDESC